MAFSKLDKILAIGGLASSIALSALVGSIKQSRGSLAPCIPAGVYITSVYGIARGRSREREDYMND